MCKFTLGFLLGSALLCPASPFRIQKKHHKKLKSVGRSSERPLTSSVNSEPPPPRSEDWCPALAKKGQLYETGRFLGEGGEGHVAEFQCTESPTVWLAFKKYGAYANLSNPEDTVPDFYYGKILDHAYVIKSYGLLLSRDNFPVVIMEKAGANLADLWTLIDGVGWPDHQGNQIVAKWILQMLVAVEYIHSLDIVHADLKPEQFMVDTEFRQIEDWFKKGAQANIKLGDFGFMMLTDTYGKGSKTWRGSMAYLDPLILTEPKNSKDTDMWAMGVIIYWMTYGSLPQVIADAVQKYEDEWQHMRNDDGRRKFLQFVQAGFPIFLQSFSIHDEKDKIIARCFRTGGNQITAREAVQLAVQYAQAQSVPDEEITKITHTNEWLDEEFRKTPPPQFNIIPQGLTMNWPPHLQKEVQKREELRKQRTSNMDNIIGFFKGDGKQAEVESQWESTVKTHRKYRIVASGDQLRMEVHKNGKTKAAGAGEFLPKQGVWEFTVTYKSNLKNFRMMSGKTKEWTLSVKVCLTTDPTRIYVKEDPKGAPTSNRQLITDWTLFKKKE